MTRCSMPYPYAPSTHCCLPVGHDGPHVTRDGGGWNDSPDYADGGVAAALAGEEADRAADSNQYCPAERGEYACSREGGHHGPHVAATCDVQNSICAVWDDAEGQAERGALLHRALDAEKERDEAVERAEKHRRAEADHRNNARCWMKTSEEWQATAEKWEKRAVRAEQERDQATERAKRAEAERAECHDCIRDAAVIREPRALTVDDITDEMVERGRTRFVQELGEYGAGLVREIITAALTEPPSRPEGAEELDGHVEASLRGVGLNPLSAEELRVVADNLASEGVRVVTEEQ